MHHDRNVILYLTLKAFWLHTPCKEAKNNIQSCFHRNVLSLYSLRSQVSSILKCCASHLTVALLENRLRHTSFNKTNWSCAGQSEALYKTVAIVRMDAYMLCISCIQRAVWTLFTECPYFFSYLSYNQVFFGKYWNCNSVLVYQAFYYHHGLAPVGFKLQILVFLAQCSPLWSQHLISFLDYVQRVVLLDTTKMKVIAC